eukprot:165398_1
MCIMSYWQYHLIFSVIQMTITLGFQEDGLFGLDGFDSGLVLIVGAIILCGCVICWCSIFYHLICGSNSETESNTINESIALQAIVTEPTEATKPLISFSNEVGCTIYEIASTLEKQSIDSKENMWGKLVNEDEIKGFVGIYTIVMGLIALTLKNRNISTKPPQESIKSLTEQLIKKLPTLSKHEYLNNLHNILYEMHQEMTDDHPRQ